MTDDSLLARLRAEHIALSEERTIDKPLPGYSSLVGRFGEINRERLIELQKRAERERADKGEVGANINFDADLLAETCQGIYERSDDGELVSLNTLLEKWGNDPVRFDSRLAEAVGAEVEEPTARAVIFAVFGVFQEGRANDIRLSRLAGEIWHWLRTGTERADSDF